MADADERMRAEERLALEQQLLAAHADSIRVQFNAAFALLVELTGMTPEAARALIARRSQQQQSQP